MCLYHRTSASPATASTLHNMLPRRKRLMMKRKRTKRGNKCFDTANNRRPHPSVNCGKASHEPRTCAFFGFRLSNYPACRQPCVSRRKIYLTCQLDTKQHESQPLEVLFTLKLGHAGKTASPTPRIPFVHVPQFQDYLYLDCCTLKSFHEYRHYGGTVLNAQQSR